MQVYGGSRQHNLLMRVILVMVTSVNGKITRGDNPDVSVFASKEDAALFHMLKERYRCYILGSTTFEAARNKIVLRQGKLRVVVTRQPGRYKAEAVHGRLEFTDKEPKALLKSLETRGYKHVLLLGGGSINTLFFRQGLVDEVHLTIEPALFAKGKNLLAEEQLNVSLRLKKVMKLNNAGTLHCVYKVIK